MLRKILSVLSIAASVTILATPVFSQNRFMDEAREQEERRRENEAIRKAEHPETAPSAPASNSPTTTEASQTPKEPAADPAKASTPTQ